MENEKTRNLPKLFYIHRLIEVFQNNLIINDL